MATPREYYVVIERDDDGRYVGEVPQLSACYSEGETVDERSRTAGPPSRLPMGLVVAARSGGEDREDALEELRIRT